jgi:hypothetical protein
LPPCFNMQVYLVDPVDGCVESLIGSMITPVAFLGYGV